jgi:MoaA/NifB/PqqE/SkfB family radical SAM enzyme
MTWKQLPPKFLHIELSTFCNAACPMCPRYYEGTDVVRPDLNLTQITLDKFKNYFPVDVIKQFTRILYCGTMGDPLMAKDCYDIFEYVHQLNPNCNQTVHTNGGIRNSEFWTNMGNLFKHDKMKLVFSIDGLEDTNHLYRRNVDWNILINNVKTFINAGGNATWEFLVFRHNEHQIEQAKELAYNMGFKLFLPKRAFGFNSTVDNSLMPRMVLDKNGIMQYKILPPTEEQYQISGSNLTFKDVEYNVDVTELNEAKTLKYFPRLKNKVDQFDASVEASQLGNYEETLNKKQIKCKSLFDDFSEIYVNAEGILLPCCYVGTQFDSGADIFQVRQIKNRVNDNKKDLDLNLQDLSAIIKSGILEKIFAESWNKESIRHGKMAYCAEMCGSDSKELDRLYIAPISIKI